MQARLRFPGAPATITGLAFDGGSQDKSGGDARNLEDSMERKRINQRGMSLVEVTIILMTLAILTAVAAPSINDYVQDAKDVKAKEDVEAIGISIMRLVRDTGKGALVKDGTLGVTMENRVDLLISEGNTPAAGAAAFANANLNTTPIAWNEASTHANADTMLRQFVSNLAGYSAPSSDSFVQPGPVSGIGWRGAYLSRSIGPDPWGYRYAASTAFLLAANDAATTGSDGYRGWTKDVVVVSAGRDGIIALPFGGTGSGGDAGTLASSTSDDIFYVVSGNSR